MSFNCCLHSPTHWPVSTNASEQFKNNLIKHNLYYNKMSANMRRRSTNENEWMKIMKAVVSFVAFWMKSPPSPYTSTHQTIVQAANNIHEILTLYLVKSQHETAIIIMQLHRIVLCTLYMRWKLTSLHTKLPRAHWGLSDPLAPLD